MHSCFFFVLLAGGAASLASLALSKTLYRGATTSGYLLFHFFIGFLFTALLNGVFFSAIPFNWRVALVGCAVGLLTSVMMFMMGKALRNGPSGLTFAFQNSGAILPPLLLAFIFSKPFGFTLSAGNLVGMALVICGLFFAAASREQTPIRKAWIAYALLTFIAQGLILSSFQWRSLLLQEGLPSHVLIPFSCSLTDDLWFMPALFFSAWLVQALLFSFSEKRLPHFIEIVGGSLGGLANALSTVFILRATLIATTEKAMLFPLFTVIVILLCNLYGMLFYREKISWKANGIAALGIIIGTSF